ncbi:MAG TPA: glutamate:protein symporter [Cyanobacteria bacterium UBA9579]|nr:glutamate:protein symporter [Cyanobacteria bacterium UBA9579]
MKKSRLTLYIFAGLILGILVGWLFPAFGSSLKPVADIFLRMIKMIIAPLIFATLVVGIAGHGNLKSLGKTSLKTFIYFEIVTTVALIIGLTVANYFQVGSGVELNASASSMEEISKIAAAKVHTSFADTFTHIIPTSVIDAMARGDLLQVVVFSIFFAVALASIGEKGRPILNGLSSLAEIMFKFTEIVMLFAPIGVFAAIANTVGYNGIQILGVYAKLIGATYFALILFVIFVLVVACKLVKIPFLNMVRVLRDPALLAFSTASSEAALPKAMEIMEKFGAPRKIVSFVMPTGYTFNLDGSTLYLSLATMFIAQASGIELSLSQQIMIMLTLMLTSKGIAGVPRVSLVILTGTLVSFNIPIAGVAILLGIDQILDMGRTTVNLIGNCVATAVIARWENCFDDKKMKAFILQDKKLDIVIVPAFKPPVKNIGTQSLKLKNDMNLAKKKYYYNKKAEETILMDK